MSVRRAADDDPDDTISELIRNGDHRRALGECARAYGAELGRFCMALLGSQEDADEAVQETLLAAHGAMRTFRGDGSVRGWLYTIARRKCARQWEARTRARRPALALVPEDSTQEPHTALKRTRRAAAVRDALSTLKPSDREAVVLRYQAGLDYSEIAAVFGIEEPAARKRVSRALARLRTTLHKEDME